MTAADWVRAKMLADASVSARLGTKVYPGVVPQGTARPYATVHLVDDPGDHTFSGASAFRAARVQVDVYADTAAVRDAALGEIRAALNHATGTQGGLAVNVCLFLSEGWDWEPELDGRDQQVYRGTHDYQVIWD